MLLLFATYPSLAPGRAKAERVKVARRRRMLAVEKCMVEALVRFDGVVWEGTRDVDVDDVVGGD